MIEKKRKKKIAGVYTDLIRSHELSRSLHFQGTKKRNILPLATDAMPNHATQINHSRTRPPVIIYVTETVLKKEAKRNRE